MGATHYSLSGGLETIYRGLVFISFISFHKEQILLLNGNDFTSDPLTVLRDVENFIGVPKFFEKEHFNFSGKKAPV